MQFNDYQAAALRTAAILTKQANLVNAALGLAGEAGEVADLVKKHLYQGHPLTVGKLALEIGDVLWYLAQISSALDLSLGDVAQANLDKLAARYPNGFDPGRSINRGEGA